MVDQELKEWKIILDRIRLKVQEVSFETWLKNTTAEFVSHNPNKIKVITEFSMQKDFLMESYNSLIVEELQQLFHRTFEVIYICKEDEQTKAVPENILQAESTNQDTLSKINLNSELTFDTFVVGHHNRFAHAAALAVAERPAKAYNPLFLYGGSGLGKTHLMHAIGQFILNKNPNMRVKYLSAENFTNEFITSLSDKANQKFRDEYRSIDVLLIDDIQWLAEKERTREEFFHTFDQLHLEQKQIVITSDKRPSELQNFEERLRSRFSSGLITSIETPDVETRIAILNNFVRSERIDIPEDAIFYIANQIDTNVRALKGALTLVLFKSAVENRDINVQFVTEVISDVASNEIKLITIPKIITQVAEFYNVNPEEVKGRKRTQQIVTPRQIAMYLSRELTDLSITKIGEQFGGRDHSTIIHAHDKIKEKLQSDPDMVKLIRMFIDRIKNLS